KWPRLQEALNVVPAPARWPIMAAFLLLCLVGLVQAYSKRSRLLKPERFSLDPANPAHLKGREQDVEEILQTCFNTPAVELTGESGSGKTALVRAGLLPALQRDGRLQPFYLDSYGQEWDTGPLEGLAATVQVALDKEVRARLGFEQPVTPDNVFDLLAGFRDKVGRTPLIIFDQFDDYQAAHRKEFRTSRGNWISPKSLAKKNRFWQQLSE